MLHRIEVNRSWILGLFVMAWLCSACGTRERGYDVYAVPPPEDTTLGPGDTFDVTVFEDKNLSGKYRVSEDGMINFPLIGSMKVGGKAPTAVAEQIQTALKEKQILRDPSVSIFVVEYTSKRVNIVGAVKTPGSIRWMAGMSVVQAISTVGGLTPLAAANDTIVTRQKGEGEPQRYKVAVERIAEGRERNFLLMTGDIVFVPERVF